MCISPQYDLTNVLFAPESFILDSRHSYSAMTTIFVLAVVLIRLLLKGSGQVPHKIWLAQVYELHDN